MDRISTASAYNGAIDNLLTRQVALTDTQIQLTSGKRVNQASDDPTAAARAERARALIARTDATKRAVDASRNAMTLTESALGDAGKSTRCARRCSSGSHPDAALTWCFAVGLHRIELWTSSLSGMRSNRLSYSPAAGSKASGRAPLPQPR